MARHAAREWLRRRRTTAERHTSLAELAAHELVSPLRRRKLEHALEGIGFEAAEQMERLFLTEFRDVPENEINAAVDAAVDALILADLSDEALFASNADPELLARRIREQLSIQVQQTGLAAPLLYERVLDQGCRYLIQIIRQLPSFQPRALTEVLDRLSTLGVQLGEMLARTPRTSLTATHGTAHDDDFRAEYFRYLGAQLDRLELLGLSMRRRPRLALSIGYVSLTVHEHGDQGTASRRGPNRLVNQWFAHTANRARTSAVRVEAALSISHRVLVRGDAGSGKTTLLDWLAVTAARGAFTGPLSDWNGCVPFPLRLRRYADTSLPRPEQFLDNAASWLAGIVPDGWIHRCLGHGSALILVDGIDEIPNAKRRTVRVWLGELINTYPNTRVVVTTRPAAADDRWLSEEGFSSITLEQMAASDVRLFIGRWHEATTTADSLPCEPEELQTAQRRLLTQLDASPHLRSLAVNPLLCAMLCALNLTWRSELPRNRMELYRAAITMLMDLRDAERDIVSLLDMAGKTVLLRDIAWRLTLANRAVLPRLRAVQYISRKRGAIPDVNALPETLLDHLLERSGMVHEAVPGQVEFVHRTFQEYLAASEATQEEYIETLVSHAHLDTWHETVVMACGHAKRSQSRELLSGVLDRADTEPRHARRLRLIAAACLETATDLDPEVRDRVEGTINDCLVPPRSTREVRSLTAMGYRVLNYLPESLDGLPEASAAAVVRTAALTGSHTALSRIARYAQDNRQSVQNEVIDAWQYFDPERYAHEVMADMPLVQGRLRISIRRLLPYVEIINSLSSLEIDLRSDEQAYGFEFLTGLPYLKLFNGPCGHATVDLALFAEHPQLSYLWLHTAQRFDNLTELSHLPALAQLGLYCDESSTISFVANLPNLDVLGLGMNPGADGFSALHTQTELRELYLNGCRRLNSLESIRHLTHLKGLALECCPIPDLATQIGAAFPDIEWLNIGSTLVSDLTPLSKLRLRFLFLAGSVHIDDLSPLRGKNLEIYLTNGQEYQGLETLGPRTKIRYVG